MIGRDTVVEVLGDVDDLVVAQIVEIGPTEDELIEARDRLTQEDGVAMYRTPAAPRVAEVMSVLYRVWNDEETEEIVGATR